VLDFFLIINIIGRWRMQTGTHLESEAEVTTVDIGDLFPKFAVFSTTEDDRSARAFRHKASGFEVRFFHVNVPAFLAHPPWGVHRPDVGRTINVFHLQYLTVYEVGDDARDELDHLVVTEAGECRAGSGEKEVTAEDGEFVSECSGCGGRASSEWGFVDDVVVEEGRDVDHFNNLCEAHLGGQDEGWGCEGWGSLCGRSYVRDWGWELGTGRFDRLEREYGIEGSGVVWHVGIPVVQHVWTRQRLVEFLGRTAGTFTFGVPFLCVPTLTQAVGRLGE
jgi:hypothetical protein